MRKKPVPSLAESKLILLYLASGMPSGIEHDEIVRFNAECGWMLYFEMEQYLTELAADGLLSLRDAGGGRKLYSATAEGLTVLSPLKANIPISIRAGINARMAERRPDMEIEQEITADYTQDSASEYPVILRILENHLPLLEINLTAPSAETAVLVCGRFRQEAADLYSGIIERLTRDEDDAEDA